MCVDHNGLTLCMSLLQAVFISMQKLQLILKLMTEHLGQDGCVSDGFKCHQACSIVLSCVMMVMWFVGVVSDPSMWKIAIKSILNTGKMRHCVRGF